MTAALHALPLVVALLAPAATAEMTLSAERLEEGSIALTGPWRYHDGDDPSRSALAFDDSDWSVRSTFIRTTDRPRDWPGVGWFRLRVDVDPGLVGAPLALGIIQDGATRVYLDGQEVAQLPNPARTGGRVEPARARAVLPLVFTAEGGHVLAVRHENPHLFPLLALGQTVGFGIWVGRPEALADLDETPPRLVVEQALLTAIPLLFCLLHVLLFSFSPATRQNLYFAILTASFAAAAFLEYRIQLPVALESLVLLAEIMRICLFALMLAAIRLGYSLAESRPGRGFYALAVLTAVAAGLGFLEPRLFYPTMVVLLVVSLLFLVRLAPWILRRRRHNAWLPAVGLALFLAGGALDLVLDLTPLGTLLGTDNPWLFGGLAFLLSLFLYLAASVATTNRQLRERLIQVQELSAKALAQEKAAREREVERRILEADHERKTRELDEARRLQLALLPAQLPGVAGLDIAAAMHTATEVGGDYYDASAEEDGALLLAIGDAAGHGARAGLLVAATKSLFQSLEPGVAPSQALRHFAQALSGLNLERLHMSLCLARFACDRLTVAGAGMPPPLVRSATAGRVSELHVEGLPLGSRTAFDYRELSIDLAPGDAVLFMSDGFPELRGPDGKELGYAGARQAFERAEGSKASEILASLEDVCNALLEGSSPSDDVTLVVVRRAPAKPPEVMSITSFD